jgi:hypothetical protein
MDCPGPRHTGLHWNENQLSITRTDLDMTWMVQKSARNLEVKAGTTQDFFRRRHSCLALSRQRRSYQLQIGLDTDGWLAFSKSAEV